MDTATRALWDFFSVRSHELSGKHPDLDVVAELDRRFVAIGDIVWEIGTHDGTPYLAISPVVDHANALRLLSAAPPVPGWNIRLYKPPKKWNLVFDIEGPGGEVLIDGTRWEVVCYRFPDGKHDLVFKPQAGLGIDESYVWDAALAIVDGELGEEARRTYVSDVDLTLTWSEREARGAAPLTVGALSRMILPHG